MEVVRPVVHNEQSPTPASPTTSAPTTATQSTAAPVTTSSLDVRASEGPVEVKLQLAKKNNGLGLCVIAARGPHQTDTGIYVKSVVSGGAADDDGRLNAGDQLLAVDEASLINVSQERAAELMTRSGPRVTLTVAKDAAAFYQQETIMKPNAASRRSPAAQLQQQKKQQVDVSLSAGERLPVDNQARSAKTPLKSLILKISKTLKIGKTNNNTNNINKNNKHVRSAAAGQTLPQNDIRASELHGEVEYDTDSTLVDSTPFDDDDEDNSKFI